MILADAIDNPIGRSGPIIKMAGTPNEGDTFTISHSKRAGEPIATTVVKFIINGTEHNAVQLADLCLKDWNKFLTAQGIDFAK